MSEWEISLKLLRKTQRNTSEYEVSASRRHHTTFAPRNRPAGQRHQKFWVDKSCRAKSDVSSELSPQDPSSAGPVSRGPRPPAPPPKELTEPSNINNTAMTQRLLLQYLMRKILHLRVSETGRRIATPVSHTDHLSSIKLRINLWPADPYR
jgi:hypothetical protein